MKKKYIDKHTFQERFDASTKLKDRYPDWIPVICEPAARCKLEIKPSVKTKYMVPKDITIGKFLIDLRRQVKLSPEQAMYIFVNKTIPPTSTLMISIYDKFHSTDGFLYLEYTGENFFGGLQLDNERL